MIFFTIFFIAIVIGYPIWDYFYVKKIKQYHIEKWKIYGQTLFWQWLTFLILMGYWIGTNRPIKQLFYTEPSHTYIDSNLINGMIVGALTVMFLMAIVLFFSKSSRQKLNNALTDDSIAFLLPHTVKERLLFLMIAITAGICEEVIFRGAMVYYLNHFNLSFISIGIISSLLFGFVHLYQGWKGVLTTAYLGAILYVLYVGTGSLWLPIMLHILIDIKFVFLPNTSKIH